MNSLRQTALDWMTEREEASKRGDYIPDDILTHMMRLRGKSNTTIQPIEKVQFSGTLYKANHLSFNCNCLNAGQTD